MKTKKLSIAVAAALAALSSSAISPVAFALETPNSISACNGCSGKKGCNGCSGKKGCSGCSGCSGKKGCNGCSGKK